MAVDSDKDKFKVPDWTGCPPRGTHLDVLKGPKLIQKLLIDEKGHYYFGRNPTDCDFVCEHASCSRVHALLLFHKLIRRFAIVDLESSHGTFVNNVRIGPLSPVFLELDQCFRFGASTRRYFLRDRLMARDGEEADGEVRVERGFSQGQSDLDSATESNTARNRQIGQIPQSTEEARRKTRARPRVQFSEEAEEVINPEDVDPSVGRFRNMVRTAVIPVTGEKRTRQRAADAGDAAEEEEEDKLFDFYSPARPAKKMKLTSSPVKPANGSHGAGRIYSSLGSLSLNAAPDLELYTPSLPPPATAAAAASAVRSGPMPAGGLLGLVPGPPRANAVAGDECPSKKKYAKEAWPKDMRRRSGSGVF